MALSAVVLPAPLGPIRPRMRPSSTLRSIPSSATVDLKALRRPWASMTGMASAPRAQKVGGLEAQPLDGGPDGRPLLLEEALALPGEQQIARARVHVHAEPAPFL